MFNADELCSEEPCKFELVPEAADAEDMLSAEGDRPEVRLILARRFLNQNWMFFGSSFGNFWR